MRPRVLSYMTSNVPTETNCHQTTQNSNSNCRHVTFTEASLETKEEDRPPSDWPQYGIITGENVSFAYAPGTPNVLKNLRFCIRANEKVG